MGPNSLVVYWSDVYATMGYNTRSFCGQSASLLSYNPRFESSQLFIVNCIERTKINKKTPGMAHL